MEALDADLAGHIYKTEDRRNGLQDHIESHLLMVSRAFAASADFRRFWSDYRMSDLRETTIRFGEKGFSQKAIRAGWNVRALFGREWMVDCLSSLNDDQLAKVLEHTVDNFPTKIRNADFIRQAASEGKPWRQAYIEWAYTCLSDTRAFVLSGAFIMPAMVYGKLGFVKKGREDPFNYARKELLALEMKGVILPLDHIIRSEIAETVRCWTQQSGQHLPEKETSKQVAAIG
jgi:hypothetical protein